MSGHVFRVGERVRFEGQVAVVTAASAPRRDMWGDEVQNLEISRYEGKISTLIGSRHSRLEAIA